MRLFRFMSKEEFDKYKNGEDLFNDTIHDTDAYTNSVGFCFMQCADESDVEYCYQFLSGIVSDEVCCIFETEEVLKDSYGIYAAPDGGWFDTINKQEFSISKYNNKTFHLLKYCFDFISSFEKDNEWIENNH